ncbi:MAG: N-acetylmuramoyl-L-alanine amidase, partial [Firmicutes bacterium]|nr:N-acetylmuramoyl-L-alanine amidase [Bacillota bacterium]
MSVIVVDAGHGGHDFGAVSGGRLEKDDTLRQVLAVGRLLQNAGQTVIYTRTTDVFLSLTERTRISNNAQADFFLSLHRNGSTNPNARGVDNFVKNGATAQLIACAVKMLSNVVRVGVSADRGSHQANFQVLRDTVAPAVLMETLFITNSEDNILFDRNFEQYNMAIANSVLQCLGNNVSTPPPAGDVAVRLIQSTLNTKYNAGLVIDGIAGTLTRGELVRGLQTELNKDFGTGLVVDGIFGRQTQLAVP